MASTPSRADSTRNEVGPHETGWYHPMPDWIGIVGVGHSVTREMHHGSSNKLVDGDVFPPRTLAAPLHWIEAKHDA